MDQLRESPVELLSNDKLSRIYVLELVGWILHILSFVDSKWRSASPPPIPINCCALTHSSVDSVDSRREDPLRWDLWLSSQGDYKVGRCDAASDGEEQAPSAGTERRIQRSIWADAGGTPAGMETLVSDFISISI